VLQDSYRRAVCTIAQPVNHLARDVAGLLVPIQQMDLYPPSLDAILLVPLEVGNEEGLSGFAAPGSSKAELAACL
jgi:hypothetical protein